MPIMDFKCPSCGYETEELVKADGKYPSCPRCGTLLEQKFSGGLTVNYRKTSCGGDCGKCGGCH